jgi:BASS family bile acid:Na+ symporter
MLLLTTLLRVEWRAMADYARRPGLAALLALWLLVLSPIVVWVSLFVFGLPESLGFALVMMTAAPPILSAAAIATLLGLDGALAMVAALGATLLAPLTVAPVVLALLGLELDLAAGAFMGRLALVVGGAFVGAAVIRRLAGRARLSAHAAHLDGLVVAVMLIFAVAIMDGVSAALMARPATVALWLAAAFVANPLLQLLGGFAFAWLGKRGALTVGLLTGNCNMGLLLAALPPDSAFDVMLYFALAQLPMYMLPAVLLPLYRRLLAT